MMLHTAVLLATFGVFVLGATERRFPRGFKFGAATASYQIEGGWDANGKGENIWDRLMHTTNGADDGSNGDIACDSYNRYKRDVEMLKWLGVDFYRFSISWSRIMPDGRINNINPDGIRYYNNLIDELIANEIEPVVTIFHYDLPQKLQDLGGWANALIADYFEEYAEVVYENFGDRVKMWLTFNEPIFICREGYGTDHMAPAINMDGIADYQCAHNLLRSHGKAYRLYDEKYRSIQGGRVSMTINQVWLEPDAESNTTRVVSDDALEFSLGWYANPIFSQNGDYPEVMKERIYNMSIAQGFLTSRLPKFTTEEIEYIKGSFDFFGLNHYTTSMVKALRSNDHFPIPSFEDDTNAMEFINETWPGSASSWLKVVPWGFTKLLGWIREHYNNPELIVFENGFSGDAEDLPGGVQDQNRIEYHHLYLNALLDAIDQGSNITGYTVWSLMDNFEWMRGYAEKFGLFSVNFQDPNRTRTPKESAYFYKNVIANHSISPTL